MNSIHPPMPFIVGASRSGTTLLRLILDAHPALSIPPETHFFPKVGSLSSDSETLRTDFAQLLVASDRWPDFHISVEEFNAQLASVNPFDVPAGLRTFYRLYAARFGKQRYGDKTPEQGLQMQLIESFLPEAHFIHLVRDGRDVATSNAQTWWGERNLLPVYARWWVDTVTEIRRQSSACAHFLEIRYEDLVTDTHAVIEKVCVFLDLQLHPKMEQYYDSAATRLAEFTDLRGADGRVHAPRSSRLAIHRLATKPPDRSRIGRWRTTWTDEEQELFETIAGDLLRSLGYSI